MSEYMFPAPEAAQMVRRLSEDQGATDPGLIDETLGTVFAATAAEFAGREALVDVPTGRRWTFEELDSDVTAMAKCLLAKGVRAGDRVGIWSPNRPEWVIVQLAVARVGAILVPINPEYRVAELSFVLRHAGIALLISVPTFKTRDFCTMVDDALPACPDLKATVFVGSLGWDDFLDAGRQVGEDALAQAAGAFGVRDPVCIAYTSGTTDAHPKGVTLSHHNIVNNAFFQGVRLGFAGGADRSCIPVQMAHILGFVGGVLGTLLHGACLVIPARSFDPLATMRAVEVERCTALMAFPSMYLAQLDDPDLRAFDLTSLRTGIMAGAPCPPELIRRCMAELHVPELSVGIGMTEMSPSITQTTAEDDVEVRTETVGRVHPHVKIKIVDVNSGGVVEHGVPGELWAGGYGVMLGYWNDPERTAEVIDADGWLHTGDLAVMRPDRALRIVGRIKDLIIIDGENVSPWEVEEVLHAHPDVAAVEVFGMPDPLHGEAVCAWLRMREGTQDLTLQDVQVFCDGKLAHYKVPQRVVCVDDFPTTLGGKPRKAEMRERSVRQFGL